MRTKIAMLVLSGALSLLGTVAHASPGQSVSLHGDALSVADVSLNGVVATDFFGAGKGKIRSFDDLAALSLPWDTTGFSLIGSAKPKKGSTVDIDGTRFVLSIDSGREGDWRLRIEKPEGASDPSGQFDLIVGLHSGGRFGLWLLEGVTLDAFNEGSFDVSFYKDGKEMRGLKQLVLFASLQDVSGIPAGNQLPEPSSLALMGIALAALGLRRRQSPTAAADDRLEG